MNLTSDENQVGSAESTRMAASEAIRVFPTGQTSDRPTSVRPLADILSTASPSTSAIALVCASWASTARPRQACLQLGPGNLANLTTRELTLLHLGSLKAQVSSTWSSALSCAPSQPTRSTGV
ncbi:hypothetical protein Taro_046738 [Colocasia esculenta]|uniref:Uncharacterized protein n=1 Tax=Colocasia esculenta TaxID=4460 RepID=A0A843X4I6_COLES|nr:hypothetical protein [Colocasia esculenta]